MPIDCPSVSALCGPLSGSAGDVTATGNQHRRYCIARTGHADPATGSQLSIRAALTTCSTRWAAATEAQRANWHKYADSVPVRTRLNPRTFISGREHWLRAAIPRLLNTLTTTMARRPSLSKCGFHPPRFVWDVDGSTCSVYFDDQAPWCFEASAAMLIRHSVKLDPNLTWFDRAHRSRFVINGSSLVPPTSPRLIASVPAVIDGSQVSFAVRVTRFDHRLSYRQLVLARGPEIS